VDSDRCPSCAARVPAGAAWCGQCWADLRPAPEAVPVPASVTRSEPASAPAPPAPVEAATERIAAAVTTEARPRRSGRHRAPDATWPCARCEAVNDVAADACRQCGAGFLAGAESADVLVPGLGPASRIDKPQKVAVVAVGTLVVTGLLLVLSLILGAVL